MQQAHEHSVSCSRALQAAGRCPTVLGMHNALMAQPNCMLLNLWQSLMQQAMPPGSHILLQ